MRICTGLLLLVALPLQAKASSEEQTLAGYTYQLAVAEAPGDLRSDLQMAQTLKFLARATDADGLPASEQMRAVQARAQVVVAELEARVDAARDSDPFLLVADLGCWPKAAEMPVCDQRRAQLEPYVADNAFHGIALMSYAWMRKDAEAFLRVARLAAAAEHYDSLPAYGFQSLVERFRKVPAPAVLATSDMDALTRAYLPEVMAMGMVAGFASPPYQNFIEPCRESEGELRSHCLAIARKMMLAGQTLFDAHIAIKVVETLGGPDDIALATVHRRELEWLWEKAMPLFAGADKTVPVGIESYLEAFGSEGEIAALGRLLDANGIATKPPAGWTKPSAKVAANQ